MARPESWTAATSAVLAISSVALVAVLAGCGAHTPAGSIVVFAAASLKQPFTAIAERFQADNPGASVFFNFAGSSELVTQLTQGAAADVFASADTANMDRAARAGLLAGDPIDFASNTLVIVTAAGNPNKISSFADLADGGGDVVVCAQQAPCGAATQRVERSTGIRLNPVSEESSVTDVLNKVTTGQADAGLVYVTDARSAGDRVTSVEFAEAAEAVNTYPVAVLNGAREPALARKFVDLVTGEAGQKILGQAGFARP